jgi:hypothetical protein
VKPAPAALRPYRHLLTVAAAVTVGSGLISVADALHLLAPGWIFVRAGLGFVLIFVLVALLVRWLAERRQDQAAPRGRLASLTTGQRWVLTVSLFLGLVLVLIMVGFVAAVV